MKAFSVAPTWAWLIVTGQKQVENRTWSTRHRGAIMVHANKSQKQDRAARKWCKDRGIEVPDKLPMGAIVGSVEILDVVDYDPELLFDEFELRHDRFAFGPKCWILRAATKSTPIPCKGKQGLFCPDIFE